MIALPAEHIVAHQSTITGSIGAIIEVPNIKGLAQKIGFDMQTIRTGAVKGEPNIFGDMSPKARQNMQQLVDDFYKYFVAVIAENRNMPLENVLELADGRVFSGVRAAELGLIDAVGGEQDLIEWLRTEKGLSKSLKVYDVDLFRKKSPLHELMAKFSGNNTLIPNMFFQDGLLSIWKNGAI